MLQTEALDILKLGHNIYLTGAAGSGKTFVINKFIEYLRENAIAVGVTASTGIAATHMNGVTIHSWAGIGIHDELKAGDIKKILANKKLQKRFLDAKVLIIDEVSMLHGIRLDLIDQVCRAFKDNKKPFGGLQVVLSGDLFQLPPVTRQGPVDFVFKSKAWKNMNLKICYLSEQYRQDDQRLLDILSAIRSGQVDENHYDLIQERFLSPPSDMSVTKLYTHNSVVDSINQAELDKIKTKSRTYFMNSLGNKKLVETMINNCLAPEELTLKIGAEVMFVSNNPAENYVNGTLGKVIEFTDDGKPIVETMDRTIEVMPFSWKFEDGDKVKAEISQLPLRLAWAITVHKSQGMSLDAAEMDLSKSFEPGMGYVALSRVRDLSGLFIQGINNTALVVNPIITKLDDRLKSESNKAQKEIKKMTKTQLKAHHKRVVAALQSDEAKMLGSYDKALFDKLVKWRTKLATKQSVPAYVILSDKSLKFIAALKPKNTKELSKIHGIGEQKLESYGSELLELV